MTQSITIPGSAGEVSDGKNSFNDLYEQRNVLFLCLMKRQPLQSWLAEVNPAKNEANDSFLAGVMTPTGPATIQMPIDLWHIALKTGAKVLQAPPFYEEIAPEISSSRLFNWVMTDVRINPDETVLDVGTKT